MIEKFSLLTNVSNNDPNFGLYVGLLITFWLITATAAALSIYAFVRIIWIKNTARAKWWILPVGVLLSGSIITISILLNKYYGMETELWVPLMILGCLLAFLLIFVYIFKIINCMHARKYHMSERKWCMILSAKHFVKRTIAKIALHGIKKITSHMTIKQRTVFYAKALRAFNLLKKVGKDINITKKGLFDAVTRIVDNFKRGKYASLEDFLYQEKDFFSSKNKKKKNH